MVGIVKPFHYPEMDTAEDSPLTIVEDGPDVECGKLRSATPDIIKTEVKLEQHIIDFSSADCKGDQRQEAEKQPPTAEQTQQLANDAASSAAPAETNLQPLDLSKKANEAPPAGSCVLNLSLAKFNASMQAEQFHIPGIATPLNLLSSFRIVLTV